MTTPSDAPPPALGELARRATELEAARECARQHPTSVRAELALQDTEFAFRSACSPAVLLQLVALATGGATAERGWAMALMELGKVPDPRLGGLHQVDVRQLTRRDRDFSSDTLRPITDDEAHAAIAKFRAARSLTPERPADA